LSISRTSLVVFLATVFGIVSFIELDIRSIEDVQTDIARPLAAEAEQFRRTADMVIKRTERELVALSTPLESKPEESGDVANVQEVYIDGAILVGADGHIVSLWNNIDAANPSWKELKEFLLQDKTDAIEYDLNRFVCTDFAQTLHNNAEASGIRAAFVYIVLGPSANFPSSGGHALNAFETTDRGIVYIDCTGFISDVNADKIVDLQLGKDYIPRSIFPEPGWSEIWDSMGKIEKIKTVLW